MLNPRLQRINFSHLARRQAQFGGTLITLSIVGVSGGHNKFGALVVEIYEVEVTCYCEFADDTGWARVLPDWQKLVNNGRFSKTEFDRARAKDGEALMPNGRTGAWEEFEPYVPMKVTL